MSTLKVLVFGSTGSGKTSLCNALSPHKMPASDSAKGVTFQSFTFPVFEINGIKVALTDTIGLNEGEKGTVNSSNSVQHLVNLIKESKEGYNLLVHVMRGPRITKTHVDNYEFFIKTLTQEKIPSILVVTGCENSSPMASWAETNKDAFVNEGLNYKSIVATCFASGGPLEAAYFPLRLESSAAVFNAIKEHSVSSPVLIYEGERGLLSTLKRTWNWFCDWIGSPRMKIAINEHVFQFLVRVGVPSSIAKTLATGIGGNG